MDSELHDACGCMRCHPEQNTAIGIEQNCGGVRVTATSRLVGEGAIPTDPSSDPTSWLPHHSRTRKQNDMGVF